MSRMGMALAVSLALPLAAAGVAALNGSRYRTLRWLLVVIAVEAAAFGYIRYVEPNVVVATTLRITEGPLAQALAGRRIVHVTDLHLERVGWRERRLIRQINGRCPDWIVVTGDLINGADGWPLAVGLLKQLAAPQGVWVVPGNTDNHFLTPRQFDDELRAAGIHVLRNAATPMASTGAWLAGVDDPVHHLDRLDAALRQVPTAGGRRAPALLLAHSPDIMPDAVAAGIPLILVGHTHGGQLGIPWLARLSDYANRGPYVPGGSYREGGTHLYVNRGIGTKTRPYRFLCPPELTVIEFSS